MGWLSILIEVIGGFAILNRGFCARVQSANGGEMLIAKQHNGLSPNFLGYCASAKSWTHISPSLFSYPY
jgi:hypothetical protein